MIDDWAPDPSIGAGAPRAAQLLRALIEANVDVTHFSTSTSPHPGSMIKQSIGAVTFRTQQDRGRHTLRSFLTRFHDRFAVILVSRPHNMSAFRVARSQITTIARKPILIYDAEAIFSEREILQQAIAGRPLSEQAGQVLVKSELDLSRNVDVVLAVNERNASQFRSVGHADVRTLRHAVAARLTSNPHGKRETILFVGPTYSDDTPNTDSVVWFVDHVLPLMRQQRGRPFRLTLVGQANAAAITAMPRDKIDQRGRLQSITGEYARALVFVAPTRFAAGIPLKVYEAASHGVPCVVTSLLAEQLDWHHEKEVLVADSPAAFASQCLRLMEDEDLWQRLRTTAYERTIFECGYPMFQATVHSLLPAP